MCVWGFEDANTARSEMESILCVVGKKSKEADSPELFTEIKPDYFVDDLIQRNNLRASDHVIDIGAGGGRYTLQFAKQCSHVTALDSCAENMNLLCSRAEMMNLHNITCRHSFWEEYQTDQIYDVSFCSMCPAICTEEEIMERYPIYFSIFGIPVDESKRYLSEYIKKYAFNGVLHEKSCYRLAMITWKPK